MSGSGGSPGWAPELYLRFQQERTQPSMDLVARIEIDLPSRILDAGCGPGNSTRVLTDRWPEAKVTGVDSSPEMTRKAEADGPAHVTWVTEHLWGLVRPGGALAFQVPLYHQMPVRQAIRDAAARGPWADRLKGAGSALTFHEPEFYHDLMSAHTDRLALWETRYIHRMPSAQTIVEMMQSTGLREYLGRLESGEVEPFLAAVCDRVAEAYPVRPGGNVLFPFRRFFLIGYA